MMQSLGECFVVCDLESTILTATGVLPDVNRDMIRLFCMRGGKFAVLSGRSADSVRAVMQGLPLSAAVCCGGSVLYDFVRNKVLETHTLEKESALSFLQDGLQSFPKTGAYVQTESGKMYVIRSSSIVSERIRQEGVGAVFAQPEDVSEPWVRLCFIGSPDEMHKIEKWAGAHISESGNHFTRFDENCCELLPENISLLSGFRAMRKLYDSTDGMTFMIGKSPADIDCMAAADHAAAAAEAHPRVKLVSDYVTQITVGEGAAAEFLYHLVREYEKKS